MSVPAGTNCYTEAKDYFATELSKCTSFQSFVEETLAGDPVAASFTHIFQETPLEPFDGNTFTREEWENRQLRHAVVTSPQDSPGRLVFNKSNALYAGGSVEINLCRTVRDIEWQSYDDCKQSAQKRVFENFVGEIFLELARNINDDKRLWIRNAEITLWQENHPDHWEAQGHIQDAFLEYTWGRA